MTQVVFLVDVSAFKSKIQGFENGEENLTNVRRVILRILCYMGFHCVKRPEYLRWGYKFFNSQASPQLIMEKCPAREFNLESFEEFESEIVKQFSRFEETIDRMERCLSRDDSVLPNLASPQDILKEAISQLFCDYAWDVPDMSSPDKHCRRTAKQLNFVFIVSCLSKFENCCSDFSIESIFPPLFLNTLLKQACLYWIDADYEQKARTMTFFNPSASIKYVSLLLLSDECLQTRLPMSTLLNYLFSLRNPFSMSTIVTMAKNKTNLCTVVLHPLQKKCLNSAESQHEIFTDKKESQFSCLEITGTTESTQCVFPSLKGESYFCTSSQEYFHTLLQMLLDRSSLLVVSCAGSERECSQFGIISPINKTFGTLTILEAGSRIHQWCHLATEQSLSDASHALDETTTATETNEKEHMASPAGSIFSLEISVLEKWAVPTTTHSEDKLLKIASNSNSSDTGLSNLLKSLQKASCAKYPNLARSKHFSGARTLKSVSAQEFQIPKKSAKLRRCRSATPNVCPRGSRFVEESLQPRETRSTSVCSSTSQKTYDVLCIPKQNLNISQGYNDEGTLLKYLRELYDAAVRGNSCLMTCSQTIVNVLSHHACTAKVTTKEVTAQHFLLSAKKINKKHENDEMGKDKRLREYQLQTLLHLELESSNANNTSNSFENVIILLRTMSFLAGAQELNRFLHETIKENYGKTLRSFLEEVGDELSIPLFPPDSPEESEDTNLFPSSVSSASMCSSVSQQEITQRKRSILAKHPSFTMENQKRQIHVPQNLLPARKTKQAKVSAKKTVSRKKTPSKIKLAEVGKVCRNLFKKDQPKTPRHYSSPRRLPCNQPFVPETPSEKQGKRRHSSFTPPFKGLPLYIEESPCKVVLQRIDEGKLKDQRTPSKTNLRSQRSLPKTPIPFRTKHERACTTPSSVPSKDESMLVMETPLKRTESVSCVTPKTSRPFQAKSATPKTPRLPMTHTESPDISNPSSRRLFTSPNERTLPNKRFSEQFPNVASSSPNRRSPRLARKSIARPIRLSFSPRKSAVNNENITPNKKLDNDALHSEDLSDEVLLITPPPKRVYKDKGPKNGSNSVEKMYITPSALSLLHLTTSPVLDISIGKKKTSC